MKGRDNTIDIAKGIGIILVAIGHLSASGICFLNPILYLFHMPLFFVLSGFFCNPDKPFKEYMVSKSISLLMPYAIFWFAQFVILIPASVMQDPTLAGFLDTCKCYRPMALWFLISLWSCFLVRWVLHRLNVEIAGTLVLALAGYFMAKHRMYDEPLYIGQTVLAYPFFAMGSAYRNLRLAGKSIYGWNISKGGIAISLVIGLPLLIYGGQHSVTEISIMLVSHPCYLLFYVYACAGIALVVSVSSLLSRVDFGKKLSFVGRNSLHIYGVHTAWILTLSYFSLPVVIRTFALFDHSVTADDIMRSPIYSVFLLALVIATSMACIPLTKNIVDKLSIRLKLWINL